MFITAATNAQFNFPVDSTTNKICYSQIVKVDSANKSEIFNRAIDWTSLNYKSANDVIQLKDIDRGKIIIKGIFELDRKTWQHTIIIEVKDGRCRIKTTNLIYTINAGTSSAKDCSIEEMIVNRINDEKDPRLQAKFTQADFDRMHLIRKEGDEALDKKIKEILASFSAAMQTDISRKEEKW